MVNYKELFLYWINERLKVKYLKDEGIPKPWSVDPVFQTTYFCNVHREDDKVTKWIRKELSPKEVGSVNYEFVIVLARFLNWPDTLAYLKDPMIRARPNTFNDYAVDWFDNLKGWLEVRAEDGHKVWGSAYVITSHGMKMSKIEYLCGHLLPDVLRALPAIQAAAGALNESSKGHTEGARELYMQGRGPMPGTCGAACEALQRVQGIGTFLAGQVIADLKNTVEHPLYTAQDKFDFVVPGPGSIRGLAWYHYGNDFQMTERTFEVHFSKLRSEVNEHQPLLVIDNQDLQNCLCEFDKYCRVKFGTGRSKRQYQGV